MKPPYSRQSDSEDDADRTIERMLLSGMFGPGERLRNLPLFMRQKDLAHVLFMAEVYQQILNVPGYVAEFGVMWGRNLNLFHCLRECFEPYNHTRHLLGFDTFSGFVGTDEKDGAAQDGSDLHKPGAYAVTEGHEAALANLLAAQEATSHLSHLPRSRLVKGDVTETLPLYLDQNPHAIFALCYFDLDLHKPTRAVLEAILPRLVRGSILVFDEVLNPQYPGETVALQETIGLSNIALRRTSLSGWKTYFVVGG